MGWKRIDGKIESFDYDLFESVVNKSGLDYTYRDGREKSRLIYARWICTLAVGVATAMVALCIYCCTTFICNKKRDLLNESILLEQNHEKSYGYAFGLIWVVNTTLVLCAVLLTSFGEIIAAGSGISEIKTILNGVKIPHALRLRTLFCKVFGTVCSVSGGLPVGKEGPMIHSGAIMGAGLSQGKSSTLGYDTSFTYFAGFRNDHEKRDFVSCGAAAGVAAAFGAPIGGVLFVLEEGASFWHQQLTWRTFFCAMISTFTLDFMMSGIDKELEWGTLGSQAGTFSFGQFNASTYQLWEVPIFILMGIGGGVIGAFFNWSNTKITRLRSRWITTKWMYVLEAFIVSSIVSALSYGLPYLFGRCSPRPSKHIHNNETYAYRNEMVGFYCHDPEKYQNDLASLFLSSGEIAIKQLFHAPPGTFEVSSLVLFWLVSIVLACWTYGLKVPSGLFVPALLIGAAYGRLWTRIINPFTQNVGAKMVDPRIYGLIGGAAMLGGVTRMTISLTVILLECTGNIQYGLPLIVTLFSARWFGNLFNEGIYDIHIHLQHLPFLEWSPPLLGTFLRVKHVMTRYPKSVRTVERVGLIHDLLLNTTHNAFPVIIEDSKFGKHFFAGIVMRKQLSVILSEKDFSATKPKAFSRKPAIVTNSKEYKANNVEKIDHVTTCLSYRDMEGQYPRYPKVDVTNQVSVSEEEQNMWVDLTPYMNETPYLIQEEAAFTRAYRLFRNSGLRHLIVVNRSNNVRGIITRHDLVADHCSRCFRLDCSTEQTLYPSSPGFSPISRSTISRRVTRKDQVTRALSVPLLSLDGKELDQETNADRVP